MPSPLFMVFFAMRPGLIAAEIDNENSATPAGIQGKRSLTRRRILVAALNGATYVGWLIWLASILGSGGWTLIDLAIFICFAIAAPWSVLGLWNALLGLWLLHATRNSIQRVAPFAKAADACEPVAARAGLGLT